jgi:hypothetical protein
LAVRVLQNEIELPPFAGVPQVVLAQDLVQRARGRENSDNPISGIVAEMEAGLHLLSRLKARRYLQAIFRVRPNLQDKSLKIDAERMAEVFRRPEVRYKAERMIEEEAGLPCGSVVIHCPRAKVAEKIANVILVMPGGPGEAETLCRLHGISKLDANPNTFGDHEAAVTAVEKMYHSMWRLVVYVSPCSRADHATINRAVGHVLFTLAVPKNIKTRFPERVLQNDPMLDRELVGRMTPSEAVRTMTTLHPVEGRIKLSPAVVDAGRALLALRPDLFEDSNGSEVISQREWERRLSDAVRSVPKPGSAVDSSRGRRQLISVMVRTCGELDAAAKKYIGEFEETVVLRLAANERAAVLKELAASPHYRRGSSATADISTVKKVLAAAVRRATAGSAVEPDGRPASNPSLF